jgi:cytochrome c-type biogenesis protein
MIEQIQPLLQDAFRQDTIAIYVLMFGGGLFASLTPCTYPVLPVTIGYIGNQAGTSRWRLFLLSLSIVTGMAVVYAILGAFVAAAGGTFGSIMGNGWFLYGIALYFLIMGLFLLDVFYFPVPRFLARYQSKYADRKGILGAFVLGGVSGLIVGPCTGPILAVAIGAIALTLENVSGLHYVLQVIKGGFLLFLFGLGQGALILIAGIFTGFIALLPRAGVWMEALKKCFALLIILASTFVFVFVGQNTDFPSLTHLLASAETAAVQESKPDSAAPTSGPVAAVSPTPTDTKAPHPRARSGASTPRPGTKAMPPQTNAASPIPQAETAISTPSVQTSIPPAAPDVTVKGMKKEIEKPSEGRALDFTLDSLGGAPVSLSSFRGKRGVVLVFFATWCVTCVKEVPSIKKFNGKAKKERITVFGVNYKQTEEAVERLKHSMQIDYEILLDSDGEVTARYGITGVPHIIGIDGNGTIVYRGSNLPQNEAEFIRKLKQGL